MAFASARRKGGPDMYIWRITLGAKTVEVRAEDKLRATQIAAKDLGVRWSQTARDMQVLRLRKAGK